MAVAIRELFSKPDLVRQISNFEFIIGQPIFPEENLHPVELLEKYPRRASMLRQFSDNFPSIGEEELNQYFYQFRLLNGVREYIKDHYQGIRVLKDRQMNAFEKWYQTLETGQLWGFDEIPMGVGKMVLIAQKIKAVGVKSLVVTSRRFLVDEAVTEIERFNPETKVGRVYGGKLELNNDVTVTTYNSFVNRVRGGFIEPNDYQAVFLDEAHGVTTKRRLEVIERFRHAVILGLTATASYSRIKSLENLFGPRIHTMTIKEAQAEGLLCPSRELLAIWQKELSLDERNKNLIDFYRNTFPDLPQAIIFVRPISRAITLANEFQKTGISADSATSKSTATEISGIIDQFRSGQLNILTTVKLLGEGVNFPALKLVIDDAPTNSFVAAKQRARNLRLDPNNENKIATLVNFIPQDTDKFPVTFTQVKNDLRRDNLGYSERFETAYRAKTARIGSVEVVDNPDEVAQIVEESLYQKYLLPPPGFILADEAAQILGIPIGSFANYNEYYDLLMGEHTGYFMDNLRRRRFYKEKSVLQLKVQLDELKNNQNLLDVPHKQKYQSSTTPPPPDGYMTKSELSQRLGYNGSLSMIIKLMSRVDESLLEANSVIARKPGSREGTYYSPAVLELLRDTRGQTINKSQLTREAFQRKKEKMFGPVFD